MSLLCAIHLNDYEVLVLCLVMVSMGSKSKRPTEHHVKSSGNVKTAPFNPHPLPHALHAQRHVGNTVPQVGRGSMPEKGGKRAILCTICTD